MINIEPVAIRFGIYATKVQLRQGAYILGSNDACRVRVLFYSDENLVDDSEVVEIPQNLVENWTDDQPIIDYVINELQLTVLPPQEPEI